MWLIAVLFMVGVAACSSTQTSPVSQTYSLLLKEDGQTWCGFNSPVEFQAEATNLKPTESVRIAYSANKLSELTYQVEAESGDWVVIDKYILTEGGANVRRAILLTQQNLQVIKKGVIRAERTSPLYIVSVSTLDGKRAELPPQVDFPNVPVISNLSVTPFVQVVDEMRSQSLGKMCRKVD